MNQVYIPTDPTKNKRASRSKYRNVKCAMGGKKFDSAGERNRYFYLADAERRGTIKNLRHQVRYHLNVNNWHICDYIADFVYEGRAGIVVEDFKGGYRLPPDWPIKQKLMRAIHGVEVVIVKEPTAAIA